MSKQLDIFTNDQFGAFDMFGLMVFPQVVELNQQTFRKVPVSDSDGVKLLNAVQNRHHFIKLYFQCGVESGQYGFEIDRKPAIEIYCVYNRHRDGFVRF